MFTTPVLTFMPFLSALHYHQIAYHREVGKPMLGMVTTSDPGTSGIKDIAVALGGGIKEGAFMLIEGEARTGKSVLSQHIAYGVLSTRDSSVAYYSSEYNTEGLINRMSTLSLDARRDLAADRFRVYKIYAKSVVREPQKSLELIVKHIEGLPPYFKLVVIDSPSVYLNKVSPTVKVDFLQACKEMCENDRTIIMTIDFHAFEKKTLFRAFAMSDYYLKLRSQDAMIEAGRVDTRIIKILEVTKLAGAERLGGEGMKFEIKPGIGIQILPFVRIRV
jgi:archaellum biogenesis ATPase FlaH